MFWTKYAQNGRFLPKIANISSILEFRILVLVYVTSFRLSIKNNSKNENHHYVLNNRNSLSTKFHPTQTDIMFYSKFTKNRCFIKYIRSLNKKFITSDVAKILTINVNSTPRKDKD